MERGHKRGTIVAAGTPEDVAQVEGSHTGGYLARVLASHAATSERAGKDKRPQSSRARRTAT